MLFSEAEGRKVVSTSTAETVGKIDQFVVDPKSHAVVALRLKKTDGEDFLPWPSLSAFGQDAVTVPGAETIVAADERLAALSGKHHEVIGRRTLTSLGDELGKVKDVEFDATTGVITALVIGDEQVDGIRLIGVGSYAVVIQAD